MGPTQVLPHRFSAGVCTPSTGNEEKDTSEKDAIINALKDRLLAVEKERDEAKKIVTDVRIALRAGLSLSFNFNPILIKHSSCPKMT